MRYFAGASEEVATYFQVSAVSVRTQWFRFEVRQTQPG